MNETFKTPDEIIFSEQGVTENASFRQIICLIISGFIGVKYLYPFLQSLNLRFLTMFIIVSLYVLLVYIIAWYKIDGEYIESFIEAFYTHLIRKKYYS